MDTGIDGCAVPFALEMPVLIGCAEPSAGRNCTGFPPVLEGIWRKLCGHWEWRSAVPFALEEPVLFSGSAMGAGEICTAFPPVMEVLGETVLFLEAGWPTVDERGAWGGRGLVPGGQGPGRAILRPGAWAWGLAAFGLGAAAWKEGRGLGETNATNAINMRTRVPSIPWPQWASFGRGRFPAR